MNEKSNAAVIARGERLKALRKKAGLTATALAEKASLSRSSISYWEAAARGGLSRNGAEKIVAAVLKLGVYCETNWLWSGNGKAPEFVNTAPVPVFNSAVHSLISSLEKEIELFLSLNQQAVVTKIEDEGLTPVFLRGDIVGGIWQPAQLISYPQICIVRVDHNVLAVKTVEKVNTLSEAAPIIRLWRY